MARLNQRELAAIRWLLGQLMILVSLAGGFALELGADQLIAGCMVLTGLSCLAPAIFERIPRLFWRVAPILLLLTISVDFLAGGGDFLPPLFRMVLLLSLFRAIQIRTPREDLQVLLLTLFLLVITGVLSQEITFGLQLLVYAPLAMGQLFLVNLATAQDGQAIPAIEGPVFSGLRWHNVLRHAWRRMDRQTLTAGILLSILTTGLALMLFVLMPRFDIGAALPFPRLQTSRSLTGFSDHVQYGDVVSILNDDSIAMRVDVQADDPPARPYWRMVVLDAYYDGGFRVSPTVSRTQRLLQNYRFGYRELGGAPGRSGSEWTLYLEGGISSYLPAADSFRTMRFKSRTNLVTHDLTRVFEGTEINANTLSIRYQDASFDGIIQAGPWDYRLPRLDPLRLDTADSRYLREVNYPQTLLVYPEGAANDRILLRAQRRSGYSPSQSAGEYAERLVDFLRRGRGYSLESRIPEGEGDALLRWVESGQAGHCELYAGAFVLISRYCGFPSRLVTGFAGGDWNGFENYYMVRNRHAHAWCEIYDPEQGWLRVDPTPGFSGEDGSVGDALAGGGLFMDRTWKAYLDSLRILWFRRVIQFDSDDQAVMADALKSAGSGSFDWLREKWSALKDRLNADLEQLKTGGLHLGILYDFLSPVLILAAIALLAILTRRWIRKRDFEAIIRRQAGQLLRSRALRRMPRDNVYSGLLLLRYGSVQSWPEQPEEFLRQARRAR